MENQRIESNDRGSQQAHDSCAGAAEHRHGAMTWLDLGPRGVRAGYGAFLAQWSLVACFTLPLGVLGMVATTWEDFGALRLLCGVGGALGAGVALGPVAWVLGQAWWRCERVHVSPAAVAVELRLPPFWRRRELGPPATVTAEAARAIERTVANVVLFSGEATRLAGRDGSAIIATGLPDTDSHAVFQSQLRAAIERASGVNAEATEAPLREPAHAYALSARLARLASGIGRSLRRPAPYLHFDLAVLAAGFVLQALPAKGVALAKIYPLLAAGFLLGVAARRWDPSYLDGLRHYTRRYDSGFAIAYVGSGTLVGLAAAVTFIGAGLVDSRDLHWLLRPLIGFALLLSPVVVAVWIHVSLLRRARARAAVGRPPHRSLAEALFAATLVPLACAHEHAAFLMLEGTARKLGPLALILVWGTVTFVYLPVRLHYFVNDPGNPANVRSCVFTTACLTLYGVFGISLPV